MTEPSIDLSTMQRLMLAGQAFDPDSALYNMAFRFDIRGALDSKRFADAVSKVVALNDCLRIRVNSGELNAHVDPTPFVLPIIDASSWSAELLEQTLKDNACTALDLSTGCITSTLYQLGTNHHVWFVMKHHIATDGAAFAELQRQVVAAYQGEAFSSAPLRQWLGAEQAAIDKETHITNTAYWTQKCDEAIGGQIDRPVTAADKHRTLRVVERLDDRLMRSIDDACKHPSVRSISRDLSRFSLFAAALLILRYRLLDEKATTLGAPFAKRAPAGLIAPSLEIGFLSVELRPNLSFSELAQQVLQDTMRSMKHISPGVTTAKTNASFDWLLNMVNSQFTAFSDLEFESEWLHPDAGDSAHALRLQIHDFDGSGQLSLLFDMSEDRIDASIRDRIPAWFRDRIPAWFISILRQAVNDVDVSISELALLSVSETEQLGSFNTTQKNVPAIGIVEKLHELASANPNALAIACDNEQVSYHDLKKRVDELAAKLPGQHPLPILLPRSIEFVVAVLAAITRKIPFVPLDVDHPDDRLRKIIDALDSPVVLTNRKNNDRLQEHLELMLIDSPQVPAANNRDTSFSAIAEVAYIIFTSGTTGKPKGVEVAYSSLNNYLHWAAYYYSNGHSVRMPLFSSVAVDLTLTSILLPIFTGGTVQLYPQTDQSSQLAVLDVFRDDQLDLIKLTPSHLRLVLQDSIKLGPNSSIKGLILGGENFPRQLAMSALHQLGENLALYNEYGPTEATIGCMIHQFDAGIDLHHSVPIGVPIDNAQIHLLDACGQAVPIGVPARMHISGDVLAKGYWNGKAIRNTLYDTGDQAIRQANGNLVYLGRLDKQRKFRGARVELEEIEAVANCSGLISDAVVRVTTDGADQQHTLCVKCGIASNVPGIRMQASSVCSVCNDFESKRASLEPYFKTQDELHNAMQARIAPKQGASCLAMVSGGKDSSYMLCKLVEMGFRPVVFTLDNGYLSEHALANVERMCKRLDLHWERQCPADMNAIFADSLRRHSNVCNGCFKTIYTLAINYALEHNIPSIITGLSRGQLFETRLLDMVDADVLDEAQIDQRVDAARKAYHLIDDKVSECLDVSHVRKAETFSRIAFFDFYRYTDVVLSDMYRFLHEFGDWQRPPDTGRSTNCLINDVGIYVHQKERDYHNYAIPYAWDVRMGHKQRAEAVDELNDDIDLIRVKDMLDQIDYTPRETDQNQSESLVAYYVAPDSKIEPELRKSMASQLPDYAMPTHFVQLDQLPLAASGKLNEFALPHPSSIRQANTRQLNGSLKAPVSDTEKALALVWQQHFNADFISLDDDFFALGGDSILAVQISASCKDAGFNIAPTDLFSAPNLQRLAELAVDADPLETPQTTLGSALPNTGLGVDELSDLLGRL
ncbi:MAG: AMP-binding protein [Pseudomonadales bacterium]